MKSSNTRAAAFTLIELLIVVAIIAILAAIAVPNFLEAQVRAKVSRVNSDHRVMAMGLEQYYVDYNSYPTMLLGSTGAINMRLVTSPVAYVTQGSVRDVFAYPASSQEFGNNVFVYGRNLGETGANMFRKMNAYTIWSVGPDRLGDTGSFRTLAYIEDNEGCLVPGSCTSANNWVNHSNYNGLRYDTTNGTVSKGDIYRFSALAESAPSQYR